MYLYNVTLIAETIPSEVVLTRLKAFVAQHSQSDHSDIVKLQLLELDDSQHEGRTFCLQIVAPTEEVLAAYRENTLDVLLNEFYAQYTEKVLNFCSKMKFLTAPISL